MKLSFVNIKTNKMEEYFNNVVIIMIVVYFIHIIVKSRRDSLMRILSSDEYRRNVEVTLKNSKSISNNIGSPPETSDEKTQIQELSCCVCRENKITLMTVPCHHACLCFSCRNAIKSDDCPMCKSKIENFTRIYI